MIFPPPRSRRVKRLERRPLAKREGEDERQRQVALACDWTLDESHHNWAPIAHALLFSTTTKYYQYSTTILICFFLSEMQLLHMFSSCETDCISLEGADIAIC